MLRNALSLLCVDLESLKFTIGSCRQLIRGRNKASGSRNRRSVHRRRAGLEPLESRALLAAQPLASFGLSGVGTDMGIDANDNIYILGDIFGTADFDLTSGSYPVTVEEQTSFVAKYNADLQLQWVNLFDDITHVDSGPRDVMEVDSQGNVYLTGYFTGTAQLGDITLTSQEESDLFAAKIDTNGDFSWAVSHSFNVGRDGGSSDVGYGVAVDESRGAVYVGGATSGEAVFLRLDTASGSTVWTRFSQHTDVPVGGNVKTVDVDDQGNLYAGGDYVGEMQLGSNTLTESKPDKGLLLQDAYITKMNPSGEFLWATSINGIGRERVEVLQVAGDSIHVGGGFGGDHTITRTYQRIATFGDIELQSSGEFDAYVAKMSTDGSFVSVAGFGDVTGSEVVKDLTVLQDGSLFVTGVFDSDSVDLDPSADSSHVVTQVGNAVDVFVSKFSSSGTLINGWRLGGETMDRSGGLAVASDGTVYTNGIVRGTSDFPNGDTYSGTTAYLLSFVDVPLPPGPPSIGSLTATPNPVRLGEAFTLEAGDVADDGNVIQVAFYLDDGDGVLDSDDLLVSIDSDGGDGWTSLLFASDFPIDTLTFFAVATDDLGNVSDPASVSVVIQDEKTKGGGGGKGGGGKPN